MYFFAINMNIVSSVIYARHHQLHEHKRVKQCDDDENTLLNPYTACVNFCYVRGHAYNILFVMLLQHGIYIKHSSVYVREARNKTINSACLCTRLRLIYQIIVCVCAHIRFRHPEKIINHDDCGRKRQQCGAHEYREKIDCTLRC